MNGSFHGTGFCFNPRPPFRAGATGNQRRACLIVLVSILARPFERALPAHQRAAHDQLSVSILARPFERALRGGFLCGALSGRVSILARPFERALRVDARALLSLLLVSILARPFERALPCLTASVMIGIRFQSSPALSSGRYATRTRESPHTTQFQSSPALSSGRYRLVARQRALCRLVSILARPFERALRKETGQDAATIVFQSSPALSSGRYDSLIGRRYRHTEFQSSPALSSGRYYGIAQGGSGKTDVSILARPFERALRAMSSARRPPWLRFNPRPPFRAGATPPARPRSQVPRSFNPRPPFRAGATYECGYCHGRIEVSILARPFERALLPIADGKGVILRFQSSPALSSGRYGLGRRTCTYSGRSFNPRPPFRAGATICLIACST